MDVRAIVLLGPAEDATAPEHIAGVPLALLDVLGRPTLFRVMDRLRRFGIWNITVIGDTGPQGTRWNKAHSPAAFEWIPASGCMLWRAAQNTFSNLAQSGADLVLVIRLGPYAEFDLEQVLQFHLDQNGRVTALVDAAGELLGTFVISSSRRNDAAFMLRHRLQEFRTPFVRYRFTGYINRMASAADLRQLAVDAFCSRAEIVPEGEQVRPGVWVGRGARVHRGARVLAPAFIGEHARVRASAVITRCSVLERHVQVDCGTVVEDASILPYTTIGAGLDVAHSVVGFHKVAHLRRAVEVEISDPKLIGMVSAAPIRALSHAASLASFLPLSFLRGLFGRTQAQPSLPVAVKAPSAALKATDSLAATDPALSNFR